MDGPRMVLFVILLTIWTTLCKKKRNVTKFLTKKAQIGIIYCNEFAPFHVCGWGHFYRGGRGMEQILSIVVRNQPGVLMRVAGMFSRRGYNIDSLAVGTTQNPEFSRMTVTMEADEPTVVQVCKQLAKLVEVEKVKVLPPRSSASRSMVLVKVHAGAKRMELIQLAEVFRAHPVDVTGESLIFVATGDEGKLKAFVDIMRPYGISEMVQTGLVALERGDTALAVEESRFEWPSAEQARTI